MMSEAKLRAQEIAARISAGRLGGASLGKRERNDAGVALPPPSTRSSAMYGSNPVAPNPMHQGGGGYAYSQPPPNVQGNSLYGAPQGYANGPPPGPYNAPPHGAPPPPPPASDRGDIEHYIMVPNSMIGALIGRGGSNLSDLSRETGARIKVQPQSECAPGTQERRVTITGGMSQADHLKSKVESFMREREALTAQSQAAAAPSTSSSSGSAPEAVSKAMSQTMEVPNERVGAIIGRSGVNMRAIQERTNTILKIPLEHDPGRPNIRTLTIHGDNDADITTAKAEIQQTVDLTSRPQSEAVPVATVPIGSSKQHVVPDDKVGSIIGKQGATVKDIQTRLGVKLLIPTAADPHSMPPMRTITITGPSGAIEMAILEIEHRVQERAPQQQHSHSSKSTHMYDSNSDAASIYGGGAQKQTSVNSTQYYDDYWNYASHYGEKTARE